MRRAIRLTCCILASAGALSVPGIGAAQAAEPRPPRTAEDHHAARRQWLEQQRLGDTAAAQPVYGGARGPVRGAAPAAGGDVAGPPGYAPLPGYGPGGRNFGPGPSLSAWCLTEFRPSGGWSGWGGWPGWGGSPPVMHLQALCMPSYGAGRPPVGGWPRVPPHDPAYPPVNRFYNRFLPPEDRGSGVPSYGAGIRILPPDPWSPPQWYWGLVPSACAEVLVSGIGGTAVIEVALPVLGATTADELELAIDARLSRREPVQLQALDGRWLRITPDAGIDRVSARPCREAGG